MKLILITLLSLSTVTYASTIVNLKKQLEKKSGCILTVTSGNRTVSHNNKIGGSKNSYHLKKDMAIDVTKSDCKLTYKQLGILAREFFNGVGTYSKHLHLDLRKKKIYFNGSY